MTDTLHQEERTDNDDEKTTFGLFRNDDGEQFLEIFTGDTHVMLKLDETELTRLRKRLEYIATPIREREE
jgi:hypothetical protein